MVESCFRALLSVLVVSTFVLLNLPPCVKGNTEILNFAASLAESPDMTFPKWIEMSSSSREIALNVTPVLDVSEVFVDSGVWVTLDLDDSRWSSYDKFTLRASWSASHPCDIYLKISEPLVVASQLLRNRPLHPTRRKYAQVYAINNGVPTPSATGEDMTWLRREPVPLTLVLEPLLFGVLPQSVVPVVLVILVVVGLAIVLLPYITRHFDSVLEDIRRKTKQE